MPRLSCPRGLLRAVVAVVVAVAVAVMTAGCSAIGSTASPSGSSTPPAAAPSVAAPVAPSAAAPVDSRAPDAAVLASTTVPLADDVGPGTLTFSVVDLSVRGQLTQLTLRLQTSGNPDPTMRVNQVIGSKNVGRILAPELIDPINLKAYSEADGGLGFGDGAQVTLATGSQDFTFNYAAPQDPVTTLDVAVGSGLPTFRDVPLTR